MRRNMPLPAWFGLAALIALADQLTKAVVLSRFDDYERLRVTAFFDLTLTYNTGAAFSFLADQGGWQRPFFIGISVIASVVIAYLMRKHRDEPLFCLGLALILGGALGNLWDRVLLGHVVDFLLFHWNDHYFPAFNLADSAITVGAVAIILHGIRSGGEKR